MPLPAAAATPTGRKCQLGALLRHLRDRSSLTQDEAGAYVWPNGKIRRVQNKIALLENGGGGIGNADLRALLDAYRVDDPETVALAKQLNDNTSQRGRWLGHRAIHSTSARQFLDLEQDASLVRMVAVEQVPTLFQCEFYIRAGFKPSVPADEVAAHVAACRERWRVLGRAEIFAVLSESCLRRMRGDEHVMREQIDHLIALSEQPNIVLQLVPFVLPPGRRDNCGLEQFALFRLPCPGVGSGDQQHLDFAFARMDARPLRDVKLQAYERLWSDATNAGLGPDRTRRFLRSVKE